ncbi:MAG TPA: SMC-Scp complex subunit ScpB [Acidimicrobiia bacterium]|nr:SMC-Scp complex subunit ScpB [Acidimicrobiia bacterium]
MADLSDLVAALEAILFVAEEPVPVQEIAEVLELPAASVEEGLTALQARLESTEAGLVLRPAAAGWRLYTRPDLHPYLERFASGATAARLSRAALETLAVVAYRQPVSRAQIAEIRGVDSEHALHTLERRGLVDVVGRAGGPGQAALYGTTDLFLERLGMRSRAELPPLADHVPPAGIMERLEEPFRPEEPSSDFSA